MLTNDAEEVVQSPDVDIVVELIGGIEPALTHPRGAEALGKPVVTGNKELLANVGEELFDAAAAAGVDLLFEASVAGGIPPHVGRCAESLAGERITRVMGIVNGTTNYVLTRMTEEGCSFAEALSEAQNLGFAERDPTADIEGFDAAAKAAIIASVAFGARVVAGDVYREGIAGVTPSDDIAAGPRPRLRDQAPRDRRGSRRRARGACASRDGARSTHPLATVRDACSTPCSYRARRWATSCSTGAAPAAAPPRLRCSAMWSTPRSTCVGGAQRRRRSATTAAQTDPPDRRGGSRSST